MIFKWIMFVSTHVIESLYLDTTLTMPTSTQHAYDPPTQIATPMFNTFFFFWEKAYVQYLVVLVPHL